MTTHHDLLLVRTFPFQTLLCGKPHPPGSLPGAARLSVWPLSRPHGSGVSAGEVVRDTAVGMGGARSNFGIANAHHLIRVLGSAELRLVKRREVNPPSAPRGPTTLPNGEDWVWDRQGSCESTTAVTDKASGSL